MPFCLCTYIKVTLIVLFCKQSKISLEVICFSLGITADYRIILSAKAERIIMRKAKALQAQVCCFHLIWCDACPSATFPFSLCKYTVWVSLAWLPSCYRWILVALAIHKQRILCIFVNFLITCKFGRTKKAANTS